MLSICMCLSLQKTQFSLRNSTPLIKHRLFVDVQYGCAGKKYERLAIDHLRVFKLLVLPWKLESMNYEKVDKKANDGSHPTRFDELFRFRSLELEKVKVKPFGRKLEVSK